MGLICCASVRERTAGNNGNNLYLSDMQDKRGGGTTYQWVWPPPFRHAMVAARQTMQPLGTLQHLSSGIRIVTNLVSITQCANLMTSPGLEEEGQWHKALTLNHLAHTGSILKQLEVSKASMILSRSWRANCTSKEHKYSNMALAAALVGRTQKRHMLWRWIQTALGNIVFFSRWSAECTLVWCRWHSFL